MGYSNDLLAGKRILVTGAGRGIGRSCAQTFAQLGARVIAVSRTAADVESLAAGNEAVEAWAEDVTAPSFFERVGALDRLDGLLNNAGTNRVGRMEDLDPESIDQVIDLNVRATYLITRAAIKPIRRAGGGSIVSVSSQMGHVGSPGRTLYCMSKHALEGMTKALAVELAEQGIRVNTVGPTFVPTPLTEPMLADPEFSEFVMNMIPMKKLATAEEVANACAFLLSDLSGSTTGTCLLVDGGWTAQ